MIEEEFRGSLAPFNLHPSVASVAMREDASDRDRFDSRRYMPASHINHQQATISMTMQAKIGLNEQLQKK